MATKLVIVESPTKARTIGKVLGRSYRVVASGGHVRDLPKTKLGVDTDNGFEPQYLVPRDKTSTVKNLRTQVQEAGTVYLATDPDREGEAIAWHIVEATGARSGNRKISRIAFHEITPEAINDAVAHPRELDMDLVNAQQARRILDRLVGYKLSPLLWKKVQRGLSAGRVQSVAVRLVVEREREIEEFVPVEYWTIEADLCKRAAEAARLSARWKKDMTFHAVLQSIRGKKPELNTQADAGAVVRALDRADYVVESVKRREARRNPAAPFITSTLQQEAARKLGFTARRTMLVAQQLYEGIELGKDGSVGLITYMRTDSTNVATSAQAEAREVIAARYGAAYLPASPPTYTKKVRGAQEAHEAIRPTTVARDPDSLLPFLSGEQLRLYRLIWQRFLASQMAPALLDQTTVDIGAGAGAEGRTAPRPYTFRASGSVIRFPGFLAVYRESLDAGDAPDDLDKGALPPLDKDEALDLSKLWPEQHFTQPPPRYTEATLVKALEEGGIGRPSTYAPILSTIEQRGYVEKTDKKFVPTDLGRVVNDLLVEQFPDVVDLNFTSQMETELDEVADGDRPWRALLTAFYNPFAQEIERAEREVAHISLAKPEPEKLGEPCPECGRDLLIRVGRFGKFIACSGFPTCRYTRPILTTVGVPCPVCGEGEMVEKRSRKGKVFYSCSRYPACTFSVWNRPIPGACPQCGGLIMVGNRSQGVRCSQCDWTAAEAPPDTGAIPHNNQPVQPADDAGSAQPRTRRPAAGGATNGTKARATTRKATGTGTTKKTAASTTTKKPAAAKKATTTTKKPATTGTTTRRKPAATNGATDSLEDLFDMEPTGTETPRRR